jgi:hypothetical protein
MGVRPVKLGRRHGTALVPDDFNRLFNKALIELARVILVDWQRFPAVIRDLRLLSSRDPDAMLAITLDEPA